MLAAAVIGLTAVRGVTGQAVSVPATRPQGSVVMLEFGAGGGGRAKGSPFTVTLASNGRITVDSAAAGTVVRHHGSLNRLAMEAMVKLARAERFGSMPSDIGFPPAGTQAGPPGFEFVQIGGRRVSAASEKSHWGRRFAQLDAALRAISGLHFCEGLPCLRR